MKFLGNIIWFVFGGFFLAVGWFLAGVLWCITIIGIPFGKQCFKLAKLSIWPFGTIAEQDFGKHPIANAIWLIFFGWEIFLGNAIMGLIFCITIIGIPFGKQSFKLGILALFPFGAEIKKA